MADWEGTAYLPTPEGGLGVWTKMSELTNDRDIFHG